jgi:isoleucyl-tRNA synthetase
LGPERFIFATDLVSAVMERAGIKDYKILATIHGKHLERVKLQHPFLERHPIIVLGDHVTLDAGTGCVHTAPGHGEDDFHVGQRYGLPVDHPVDARGVFMEGTPHFAGLHVFKANDAIIDHLRESGHLLSATVVQHSYPHCWRHKKPIIFRATPQWFISMEHKGLRKEALAAIRTVQWFPEWGEARIYGMVDQSPDWCISRQRTWCVPIPVFVHKETQQLHPRTAEIMEQVASLIEKEGIDAWYDADAELFIGADAKDYLKANDGLDVWFDSGVSHSAVLESRPDLSFPADLYLEGSDQHRGWFQSSLKTSVAMRGVAPYKQVLTHGFTVDAQGRKMSKSLGNTISPQEITKTLGADVLRLWVSATDYRGELSYSDEIIKRVSDAYRRIRNTSRYLLSNLDGFDPVADKVELEDLVGLDRWILYRAVQLQKEILSAYNTYQFHLIYQAIHNFCAVDLGAFYLDIIKDRQYTLQAKCVARRSAQTVMYYITEALVRWLAPILSFTAEEVWQSMPGDRTESVFLETFYNFPQGVEQDIDVDFWNNLMTVRDHVNKALETERAAGNIGAPLEAKVTVTCAEPYFSCLSDVGDELRFFFITSGAEVLPSQNNEKIAVTVTKLDYEKCVRCWHRVPDIGANAQHPELCQRCVENIEGEGEHRSTV